MAGRAHFLPLVQQCHEDAPGSADVLVCSRRGRRRSQGQRWTFSGERSMFDVPKWQRRPAAEPEPRRLCHLAGDSQYVSSKVAQTFLSAVARQSIQKKAGAGEFSGARQGVCIYIYSVCISRVVYVKMYSSTLECSMLSAVTHLHAPEYGIR